MAKKICCICQKELGLLSPKTAISDGAVCSSCLKSAGISTLGNPQSYNTATINEYISSRRPLVDAFTPTKKVGTYLQIDEANRTFKVEHDLFRYSELLSFELLEDGNTITKGGVGRAVAGGLLFGGVGAIVGGVTGGKKSKATCTSMKIRLTLKNAHTDTAYINLILSETKTGGLIYKTAQDSAQKCLSALQIIADETKTESNAPAAEPSSSAADEIMKYKQLLDAGVITQEEFDAKKKQLLGL